MNKMRVDWRRLVPVGFALLAALSAFVASTWTQEITYGPCLHGEVWWTVLGPDGVRYLDGSVPVADLPRCAGGER